MRLVCVLTACVSSVSGPAFAQGFRGGVEGGVNFTTISSGASGVSNNPGSGLFVGAYSLIPVAPRIGIQPELAFTQKHAQQTFCSPPGRTNPFLRDSLQQPVGTCTSGTTTLTEQLDYLEIPFLLRVRLTGDRNPGVYVITGPGLSLLVRAKGSATGQPEQDTKDDTTGVDVNFVVGGGVVIRMFALESRYDVGLRTVDRHPASGDPAITTGTFTILVLAHF